MELKRSKAALPTLRTNCKEKFEAVCGVQEKLEEKFKLAIFRVYSSYF